MQTAVGSIARVLGQHIEKEALGLLQLAVSLAQQSLHRFDVVGLQRKGDAFRQRRRRKHNRGGQRRSALIGYSAPLP
jgi:hypothetical protein